MVVGDISTGAEVVVIGAGPAGYAAAIRAGQLGLDVVLVERDAYGGTCLNHGCIPSKALISATDLAHRAGTADDMGIHADPTVEFEELIGWKDRIVRRLTAGVEKLCKGNGVTLVEGTGVFLDENRLRVYQEDEGRGGETIAFEHAIIATGSRPVRLPTLPIEEDGILDSRQALAQTERPDSVIVVGAGYIGMELAGVFAKLGVDVTVVELLERGLLRYDEALVTPVMERAEELGISFAFEREVVDWERSEESISITVEHEGEESTMTADQVLVAVGREPVSDTLGLDEMDLELRDDGSIATNDRQQTDREGIYAIGDVTGDPMLAHVGMAQGVVASEAIAGQPAAFDRVAIPEVVFTDPEIAVVGLTAEAAEDAGYKPRVGEFPYRASGRAMTVDESAGFIRLVADRQSDRLLGGAVVGREASELIGEIGLGVEMGSTLEDIARTIHTHPTLSEGIMEAAAHAHDEAIHRLNR